ncbi:MAG: hypothetical protein NC907_04635, partial [Candidatus Omnitrophica bacterium]|nr:hypothetical protein [Candidatus Omnitrophota bacterium]
DVLTQRGIEIITEKVNSIKDHPALLYYYLIDEPEGKINFSPKIIKETYELMKKLDPYHPVQITNESITGIKTFIDCADMFCPDPYVDPLIDGSLTRPMTYIISFMEEIKKAGKGKKFVGITPQVFDAAKVFVLIPPHTTRNNRAPSFVEERCMNYLAVICGAKGFQYYSYGKNDPESWGAVNIPDLRVGMPYLIKEKKSLEKVILHGKAMEKKVKATDQRIKVSGKILDGKFYLFAVNTAGDPINPEIEIPGEIKKIRAISENRTIEINNGKFVDRFDSYDTHIYTSDLAHKDVIDLKKVEQEIKKEGGWFRYQVISSSIQ